ncbi:MAG: Tic20 family protein [Cyanobacteria bacterium J06621_11]
MNGSATALDRAFAALAYVMPLTSALGVGAAFFGFLRAQAPVVLDIFSLLLLPLTPFIMIETQPFLGLIVFIALFAFVVQNTSISRFIRFNVLQAILVSFVISVGGLAVRLLGPLTQGLLGETLLNVFFLGGMAIVVYSVAQSVMGRYAEIPTVSEAINMQLP